MPSSLPRPLIPSLPRLSLALFTSGVLGLVVHAQEAAPPPAPAASASPAASPQAPPSVPAPLPLQGVPAEEVRGSTTLAIPDEELPLRYVAPNKKAVSKGELLAMFENSELYGALGAAQKELKALKAATAAAQREAETIEASSAEKVANATFEATKAAKALEKYLESDAPAAEITLTLALADAEANFKQQTERYNVRDKMLEEGYIRKVEYDNEEHLLQKTRLLRDAAKLKLDAFLKYDKEQTATQLKRTLNDKNAALAKAQEDQKAAIAKAQKAIENCGKAEAAKVRQCEALKKQIGATIILAPRDGTFVYQEGSKFVIGEAVRKDSILGMIEK